MRMFDSLLGRLRGSCASVLMLVALAAAAPDVSAEASLTYSWSDLSCGTVSGGVTTLMACSNSTPESASFSSLVNPGTSIFVTRTLNYTFVDDGATLATPAGLPIWLALAQVDTVDTGQRAAIYLSGNGCDGPNLRDCNDTRGYVFNNTPVPNSIVLGGLSGGTAETISQSVTFTAVYGVLDFFTSPVGLTASLGVTGTRVLSAAPVTAVPEPSTYALLLTGLAAVALGARRRARR